MRNSSGYVGAPDQGTTSTRFNVPGARSGAERGELLFGTMDSWLVWNLTGGPDGGLHATDASNAGQTQLLSLATLDRLE